MKKLIATHIDLDGSSSAVILKKLYHDADIIYVNYNFEDELENRKKIMEYDFIIFCDISFRPSFAKLLNRLVESGEKEIVLLDHHNSAISKFKEENTLYDWMTLDESRSGALLAYDYAVSLDREREVLGLRRLAELTDDYDRWVHKFYDSIRLQFLWNALGRDLFFERFIYNSNLQFSKDEEIMIKESEDKLNESIKVAESSISELYIMNDCRKFKYVSNVPHLLSLVSLNQLRNHDELDFIVYESGYGSLSLRSKDGIIINDIAEALGGGGHLQSAGCPKPEGFIDVPKSIINREWMKIDLMKNFMNPPC